MREILFRAKRKNWRDLSKEEWWVEGYYCYFMNEHCILPKNLDVDAALFGEQNVFVIIDPETLCQYTGLKDKNGNRIWENDIVRIENSMDEGIGNIEFYGGMWYVDEEPSNSLYDIVEYDDGELEVIGNIFDTPELLKGE